MDNNQKSNLKGVPMVKTNHWGYQIDSEVPTTGVFHASNIEFIFDEAIENGATIDLNWEEHT